MHYTNNTQLNYLVRDESIIKPTTKSKMVKWRNIQGFRINNQ